MEGLSGQSLDPLAKLDTTKLGEKNNGIQKNAKEEEILRNEKISFRKEKPL